MRKDILDHKDLILDMISKNYSKIKIANFLNCKIDTLTKYLKLMDIEYNGNMSGKGFSKNNSTYIPIEEHFNGNVPISSNPLKRKLFKEKLVEHICSSCKLTEWLGKPIPLELDHIDGDSTNNSFSNLRLLCPNCHAQTDTYRGKNIKKSRTKNEIKDSIKNNKIIRNKNIKQCKQCSKTISSNSKIFCSEECYHKSMKKFDISKEDLTELIWKYPTTKIAKMYGVSDKSIEKRCKMFDIEKPPRGYWVKKKFNKN